LVFKPRALVVSATPRAQPTMFLPAGLIDLDLVNGKSINTRRPG
jgi:hypothetical protein